MKTDIYVASQAQKGRSQNEDQFLVKRDGFQICAVADGAGHANLAAKRTLNLFAKLYEQADPENIFRAGDTLLNWVKLLDAALLGGAQSTFCAFSVCGIIGTDEKRRDIALGVCAGDTRLYIIDGETGKMTNITATAKKTRLGSGAAEPLHFCIELSHGALLLLLSDGAYSPMSFDELRKTAVKAKISHPSEIPGAIIARAAKYGGLADDATAVVLHYH